MSNIDKFSQFGAFEEAYEISKHVELVGKDKQRYRIDIFREVGSKPEAYCANYYVEKRDVALDQSGTTYEIWVEFEAPWVSAPSDEEALGQAMGFLAAEIEKD